MRPIFNRFCITLSILFALVAVIGGSYYQIKENEAQRSVTYFLDQSIKASACYDKSAELTNDQKVDCEYYKNNPTMRSHFNGAVEARESHQRYKMIFMVIGLAGPALILTLWISITWTIWGKAGLKRE